MGENYPELYNPQGQGTGWHGIMLPALIFVATVTAFLVGVVTLIIRAS